MKKRLLLTALALCAGLSVTVSAQAAELPGENVPVQTEETEGTERQELQEEGQEPETEAQGNEDAGVMPLAADSGVYRPYADAEYELKYEVDQNGVTITGFVSDKYMGSGDLVIPGEIQGMHVTAIGSSAFRGGWGFKGSLTLPDGLVAIGDSAFEYCSGFTGSLTLPESLVSIGNYAFDGCLGFTGSLTLPERLISIGEKAFSNCYSFTGNLTLPESLVSIGNSAFSSCSGFTGSLTLLKGMEIGSAAFNGCSGLTNLTLPEGLTEIKSNLFNGCSGLTSLTLPKSLKIIGDNAFRYCNNFTGELVLPEGLTEIGSGAFEWCQGFSRTLALPSSLVKAESAFSPWSDSIEVRLAEGVTNAAYLGNMFTRTGDAVINVIVPGSVTEMNAPEGCFIYGYRGSFAESYAKDAGRVFVPLDGMPQIEECTVGTVGELQKAIGSYRHIILKDGVYELPGSLHITGEVFLTLEAEHDGMAEILVQDGKSPVVKVEKSAEIEIKGCILGHDSVKITEDACGGIDSEAYVVSVLKSNDVQITGCDLYGCGFVGVYGECVQGVHLDRCVIRDCQTHAAELEVRGSGHDIIFTDCVVSGNGKLGGAALAVSDALFSDCIFLNNLNYNLNFFYAIVEDLSGFENCHYYDNRWQEREPKAYGICLNRITWAVEDGILRLGYPLTMEDGTVIESAGGKVLDYSDSSLPWKEYKNVLKQAIVADGIQYRGQLPVKPDTPSNPDAPSGSDAPSEPDTPANPDAAVPAGHNGWYSAGGREYWYENGIRQGTEGRGKEIYDPASDAWYWLDSVSGGAKAAGKDVYQESSGGKWVRYDENGRMVKGEDFSNGAWYYFEPVTGTMMKGAVTLDDGRKVFYDTATGRMVKGEYFINGRRYYFDEADGHLVEGEESNFWVNVDGRDYWYEGWQRQGWNPADISYRGKEIYDPASDAWYWLDSVNQGAKAVSKDVYQESYSAYPDREDGTGKWVRYDEAGHMVKGWQETEAGTWYFEEVTGAMAKGAVTIDGANYYFDEATGIRK